METVLQHAPSTGSQRSGSDFDSADPLALDAIAGFAQRILWVVVDASYCNRTVLSRIAERTVLIGRARKDIHLSALPEAPSGRGRRRVYGKDLGTPEQMRQDNSIPWQHATIFAAGRPHQLRYKSVGPLLWRRGAQRL